MQCGVYLCQRWRESFVSVWFSCVHLSQQGTIKVVTLMDDVYCCIKCCVWVLQCVAVCCCSVLQVTLYTSSASVWVTLSDDVYCCIHLSHLYPFNHCGASLTSNGYNNSHQRWLCRSELLYPSESVLTWIPVSISSLRSILHVKGLQQFTWNGYGVATVSRIDKIIGLFCKRDL